VIQLALPLGELPHRWGRCVYQQSFDTSRLFTVVLAKLIELEVHLQIPDIPEVHLRIPDLQRR
jgi:hypothetical protein